MTKRIPQPRSELSPSVRVHEAKLLAVMLRTSRLTWVFGEPGTDTGELLRTGVMPLLQRRRGDRDAAAPAVMRAATAPERRRRPARPRAELAIHFDDWGPTPLSALKRRIVDIVPKDDAQAYGATLADMLQRLHQRMGLHVVVLLDRFERYLAMAPDEGEAAQFDSELVEAIVRHELPASFLIAMDEAARPRLERLRARIPGFDHDVLRLSPVSDVRDQLPAPLSAPARTQEPPRAPQPRRPPPRVPVKVEDVYALIESTLSRSKAGRRPEQPDGDAPAR